MSMQVTINDASLTIGLGDAGELVVDVAKLAESSAVMNYIIGYGLKQMLNDVHASVTAKVEPDVEKRKAAKVALSQKKLDSLYNGQVAQARASSSGDRVTKEIRRIATEVLKGLLAAKGMPWGKFEKAKQQALVEKYIASHEADLRKQAIANLEAVKSNSDDFDLDDLLA